MVLITLKRKSYTQSTSSTQTQHRPKVFISELLVEEFSEELQNTIKGLVEQIDEEAVTAENFLYSGRHWDLDSSTYELLLKESEYAAWTAAWGFRANHFTVSH